MWKLRFGAKFCSPCKTLLSQLFRFSKLVTASTVFVAVAVFRIEVYWSEVRCSILNDFLIDESCSIIKLVQFSNKNFTCSNVAGSTIHTLTNKQWTADYFWTAKNSLVFKWGKFFIIHWLTFFIVSRDQK